MKNALKFISLLLFIGCTQEKLEEPISIETSDTKIKTITKKELLQNKKLDKKIYFLESFNQDSGGKSNLGNSIYINTERVKYIEQGDYHSYSFFIKRNNNSNLLENLLIAYQPDQTYKVFLVKYEVSQHQLKNLNSDEIQEIKSSMREIDFDYNSLIDENINKASGSMVYSCTTTWKYTPDEGQLVGAGNDDLAGWYVASEQCGWVYVQPQPEPESIDAGDSSSGGGTTTGGSGTTGGTTSDSDSGSTDTSTSNDTDSNTECFMDSDGNCIGELTKPTLNRELDDEYQIFNELEGKALCVFNELKSTSTGFKNSIKKFEPDFPVAHLKFDLGDIGVSKGKTIAPNNNPITVNSPDYVITIRLNNNETSSGVTKRPNLLIAKTIAHEVIHAEMFRKLLSVLDNGGNITGVTRQDVLDALEGNFPGMYDYFRRHKNWQHQQMATHYRKTLARILQEYDTGVSVPDNQQPSQLYMDLSWEGLIYEIGDNAIYTWTSLHDDEKNRIKNVISDYIEDNSNETCTE